MQVLEGVATWIVPLLILAAALMMASGKRDAWTSFLKGAREGLESAVGLIPTLVALMVAVRMLEASGLSAWLSERLSPLAGVLGIPTEILPLLLTRPVSGSASMAVFSSLMETYGVDSFPALCAAVIMGSSDTVIYIAGVYFGSVGIRRTRYALPVAFLVMIFSVFFSCLLCRLFFG